MKKAIWITGTLLAIGIAVIIMYFSFSQGKDSSITPEGTFVKEAGDEMEGLRAVLITEGTFIKGAEVEWRQSA